MNTISIDNLNGDGYTRLQLEVARLNAQDQTDPTREVAFAILPELDDKGQIVRLDLLTVPAEDPGLMSGARLDLLTASVQVIAQIQYERAHATASRPTIKVKA